MTLQAVQVSQTPESKFREFLASRPKPQRYTDQQREMVKLIFSHHHHFDAEQLLEDMKRAGLGVSRATAYRTLSKLVDAGLLRRLEVGTRTLFEHDYGYPQHDHLICERCGKVIEFQSGLVDQVIRDVSQQHQFHAVGHSFIVRGTCLECNRARVMKRKLDLI